MRHSLPGDIISSSFLTEIVSVFSFRSDTIYVHRKAAKKNRGCFIFGHPMLEMIIFYFEKWSKLKPASKRLIFPYRPS